jgi:hypothetical protein
LGWRWSRRPVTSSGPFGRLDQCVVIRVPTLAVSLKRPGVSSVARRRFHIISILQYDVVRVTDPGALFNRT